MNGESLNVEIYGSPVIINTTDQITICGKTFPLNSAIEEKNNINEKIEKLEKQLNKWKKRNLTVEGRILISKTFGISQTIYTMQNTYYSP